MKVGFIGCGKMGGALAKAASKADIDIEILLCDARQESATELGATIGGGATDIKTLASSCDYIFLGVKPQGMESMLLEIQDELKESNPVLITMAAGLDTATILKMAGGNYRIIRIMPNLAVAVGEGAILYALGGVAPGGEEETAFKNILSKAGKLYYLEKEDDIDIAMAISGCGPAYVAMAVEGFSVGGEECGIDKTFSKELACQTLIGTAKLLMESGQDPMALCKDVCSPGGTTIEGVKVLEKENFIGELSDAVDAAYKRSLELKKG